MITEGERSQIIGILLAGMSAISFFGGYFEYAVMCGIFAILCFQNNDHNAETVERRKREFEKGERK